jgi:hypothetical protein
VAPQTGFWGEVEAFTGHPDDAGDQPVPLGLQCVGGQGKDLVKPDLLAPAVAVLGRQGGDRLVSLAARQLGGSSAWRLVSLAQSADGLQQGWLVGFELGNERVPGVMRTLEGFFDSGARRP